MLAGSLFFTAVLYGLYPQASSFLFFTVLEFTKTSILSAYSIPVKALVAELLPIQDRGRVYGRYMTVISFGGMISPLIGGYVSENMGSSVPFYIAAGVGLLGIIAVFSMKYDGTNHEEQTDHTGNIRKLLKGSVLAIFSVRGLFFFGAGFTGSFLSIFLNESPQFMASESHIGAFFTVLRAAGAFIRAFIGDICDRIGNKLIITTSLAGMGLSYIELMYLSGLIPMYLLGVAQGLCQASADTSMMLQLITVMPKERSGLTMGLYSEAENVGGIISTPTIGYLYQNMGVTSSIWLIALVMLANAGYSYAMVCGKELTTRSLRVANIGGSMLRRLLFLVL